MEYSIFSIYNRQFDGVVRISIDLIYRLKRTIFSGPHRVGWQKCREFSSKVSPDLRMLG
jgi:hypothetical protein